jgi:FtsZ-binding cell division protein ZapB
VIADLVRENEQLRIGAERLREAAEQLQTQVAALRERITALELAQDDPPPHLG